MDQFQKLYHPIMEENFKDCFEINEAGKFIID